MIFRNQAGAGHGIRNHTHASGNRLSCYFYAMFHVQWRPEKIEVTKPQVNRIKKNQENRRK